MAANGAATGGTGPGARGNRRVIWVNRFFHPDESATSIMLTDLVRTLADEDPWHQHVVTSAASYTAPAQRIGLLPGVAVHRLFALGQGNSSLPVRLANFLLFYGGALLMLLRHARKGDAVIALTDPPLVGVVVSMVARLKGAQVLHWVQDIFPETATRLGFTREGGLADRAMRGLRNWSWRSAAACVAIGERMRDYLVANGVAPERVAVIQNWAADEAIQPLPGAENALRKAWNFGVESCVVGYSGNLGRAHDVATMIDAMQLLADRGEERIFFLYIGGGARQAELRDAARDHPAEAIVFQPYQPIDMLAQSLSVPDVHWISLRSELEGLIVPSKFYGVLAVARPLIFIGDPQGEIARLIREADCGQTFAPGESVSLAEYMVALADDPEERQRLGANGRRYLERALRRTDRISEWRALLSEVV